MRCPKCQSAERQNKIGKTRAGSQRYRGFVRRHSYTPQRKSRGYDQSIREKAIRLYVDGTNLRRIGRQLGVNPKSVDNWIKACAEKLPAAPVPQTVSKAEMEELFTFIGEKKTEFT